MRLGVGAELWELSAYVNNVFNEDAATMSTCGTLDDHKRKIIEMRFLKWLKMRRQYTGYDNKKTIDKGITTNLRIIDFLDVTLHLGSYVYTPYLKPKNIFEYVNGKSNNP